MPIVKTVGIISKPNVPAAGGMVPRLIEWLTGRGIDVRIDEHTAYYSGDTPGTPRDEVPEGCDLVIVLGGDAFNLGVNVLLVDVDLFDLGDLLEHEVLLESQSRALHDVLLEDS